jgi:hypothetical protein
MSVTFFLNETTARNEWVLECSCGKTVSKTVYESYADGLMDLELGNAPVCEDEYCAAYSKGHVATKATEADAYAVNVGSYNAKMLLEALGSYDEYMCGEATAEDFLGRVLLARAITPADEGVPSYQVGRSIYCGRPEGYTEDRFARLEALAKFALEQQCSIVWS